RSSAEQRKPTSLPGRWRWCDRSWPCDAPEQNALHTLIHQRHLTPSCGGHAPTAERTLYPARMFAESLTPRPELENGQDPTETWPAQGFRTAKALFVPSLMRDTVLLLHGHASPREGHMAIHIRRREFIVTVGSAAVAWPLAVPAQQPDRTRRIGVLMNGAATEATRQSWVAAFNQALRGLGWAEGQNIRVDVR